MNGTRIGGLWVNTDKNGNKYLGGTFGSFARMRIIKNGFKEKDGEPDYIVYVENKSTESNKPADIEDIL